MLLALALASEAPSAARQRVLTDGDITRIASAPYDKTLKSGKSEVLGLLHGGILVADYPCGDICPTYTTRIIHYTIEPGPKCEAFGGVVETRGYIFGIGPANGLYCIPKVLSLKRPPPAEVCGISRVLQTYGGVSIAFSTGRWFNVDHLGMTKGYLVGPKKIGDPFAKDAHPELKAYVGDTGWTRQTLNDVCHIQVVGNERGLGLKIVSQHDFFDSRVPAIETQQLMRAEGDQSHTW